MRLLPMDQNFLYFMHFLVENLAISYQWYIQMGAKNYYYRPQTKFGARLYVYRRLSVLRGEYLTRYTPRTRYTSRADTPLGPGTPPEQTPSPRTRYTPGIRHALGPGTPPDQVHPLGGDTPWDQVHPLGPSTPPWEQTPPRTRYTPLGADTSRDQVHPLGADTPQDHIQPPGSRPPGPRTPPREQTPQDQVHPPGADSPGTRYTPRRRASWEIRSTRGRSASYWNVILFGLSFS